MTSPTTAAVIGLVGIIAGALLAGLLTIEVERRKRQKLAWIAGRMISSELKVVRTRVKSSVPEDSLATWWSGMLPTDSWKAHAGDLAPAVTRNRFGQLAVLYADIGAVDVSRKIAETKIEAERANGETPSGAVIDPERQTLSELAENIEMTRTELANDLGEPKNPRLTPGLLQRIFDFSFLIVAPVLLFALAALFVFVIPQPDVNATTVSMALESSLAPTALADCRPDASDWSCNVYKLSAPRAACQSVSTAIGISSVSYNFEPVSSSGDPCKLVGAPDGARLIPDSSGGAQNFVVESNHLETAAYAQEFKRLRGELMVPKERLFNRFIAFVFRR
jgi:hypothetical protein